MMNVHLRAATREEALDIAALVDLAGEGMHRALWAGRADYGQDPIMVGISLVEANTGPLSWTNATLAEVDGEIAGLVITDQLAAQPVEISSDTSPILRPLIRLENKARQSRTIVSLVTAPKFRRQGVGSALLARAEAGQGPFGMSAIVGDQNAAAQAFLRYRGYRNAAELPLIHAGWNTANSAWFLMRKQG